VLPVFLAVAGVAATVALSAGAVWIGALTARAGAVAAIFGSVIVVLGGFPYLLLLVLFVVASVLATRFRFAEKQRRNVQEGRHGERGVSNVLAHILIPTGLVLVGVYDMASLSRTSLAFLYTSALAFGASDTFASEFGVLTGRARSLLTGRPVVAGTNGGVSVVGEGWALVGALTTAVVGTGIFEAFRRPLPSLSLMIGGATLLGFVGCQLDSILGETLENRGLLSKGGTNLLAMLLTVLLGAFTLHFASGI
jgi:uncharacterized protein (TIGR00297 family)